MYEPFLRRLLFCLPPEVAHSVTLKTLKIIQQLGLGRIWGKLPETPRQVMGLNFPNPIGVAAGLDKNGEYIDALSTLGFGFIEVGTVTPKPQMGNPKPRLFRLTKQEALINRLGFNNRGIDYLIAQLKKTRYRGILGINIGKNRATPIEHAVDDYKECFVKVAPFASYVTLNVSSPNTENLRALQHGELLQKLLLTMKDLQARQSRYIPLVVKIAPDLTAEELTQMGEIFLATKIDGVIATNTTVTRPNLSAESAVNETGGLSGKPLQPLATQILRQLHEKLGNTIPLIGCGGITDAASAQEKFQAGAQLIQVYTGLVYRGPGLRRTVIAV